MSLSGTVASPPRTRHRCTMAVGYRLGVADGHGRAHLAIVDYSIDAEKVVVTLNGLSANGGAPECPWMGNCLTPLPLPCPAGAAS